MAYDHLADFLAELQDDGELVRIAAEVDPELELAEITDRVSKSPEGGPALFFENVKGSSIPVVTNLLGSRRRMVKVLGAATFDEVGCRIAGLIKPDVPEGWLETLRLVPQFTQLTRLPPQVVKTGVCQQVVKLGSDVDLAELPIPRAWPADRAPAITAGQVYTRDPEFGVRNVGLYPLEVLDRNRLAIHWTVHQGGARQFARYRKQGRHMPVAVALGGDPLLAYAAGAPLPPQTDECVFAGFLRNRNVDLVACRSNELEVPAHAEIVIEGYIDASAELVPAGPLGGPTGFYALEGELPVMEVTALTHRSNPILPALVYGRPPAEDYWMQRASERIFLPLVRLLIPELTDYHMPRPAAFRNLLFAGIRKEYPHQARKVMNALWSLDRLMVSKMIVIVDDDVDVRDEEEVWFRVGANVHPGRDVVFSEGPADMLDHAAPVRGLGHKMGLDATRKLPDEGHPRPWPDMLHTSRDIQELVSRRWEEYGLAEHIGDLPLP